MLNLRILKIQILRERFRFLAIELPGSLPVRPFILDFQYIT